MLLPRGNGKTTLLAAVALHHLLTAPRPAVYCGAASTAQAAILFEAARDFAARPALDGQVLARHLELRRADGAGHLRVIPSNGPRTHGLTPSLAICDELHAHRDDGLYLAFRTAMLKRPDARLVTITTAAPEGDSPLGRLRARALGAPVVNRRGAVVEAHGAGLRLLEWSVPDDKPAEDLAWAKRANPASWITPNLLAEQREALPENAWAQLHLDRFVTPEGHWLPAGAWQAAVGQPRFDEGERVWVGVDVGGTESASVVAWVGERGDVGVAIHEGEEGVLRCIDTIRDLAARYAVQEVNYDPWRFGGQPALELERDGLVMVQFPQTDVRMVPASQRLREAVVERRLTLPDDRELAAHAARAIARQGRRGWRLDKDLPRRPH